VGLAQEAQVQRSNGTRGGARRTAAAALFLILTLPGGGLSIADETDAPPPSTDGGWVLSFSNGDTMHCRFHTLESGKLALLWDVAPATPVQVDLKTVDHAVREQPLEQKVPGEGEILRLRDGSVLYGTAVGFTRTSVEFDITGVGNVTLPRTDISEMVRATHPTDAPSAVEGAYVVTTTSGDRLVGDVQQEDGKIVIRSEAIVATCVRSAVQAIAFPLPKGGGETATERPTAPKPYSVAIALQNGSRLGGTDPSIRAGIMTLKLPGGQGVSVPVANVSEVSFSGPAAIRGATYAKRIMAWGAFADRDDEFVKTLRLLKTAKADWEVVENFSRTFDAEFRRELFRSRALLIPEMETWPAEDMTKLGAALRPIVDRYVKSGRNVVVLGVTDKQRAFLAAAGLFDVRQNRTVDNQMVTLTPPAKIFGDGVAPSFKALNATYCYFTGPTLPATVLGTCPVGPVVLGRRIGRGWVILMGMDFYEVSPKMGNLLSNTLTKQR
jgi:hypothetical protein